MTRWKAVRRTPRDGAIPHHFPGDHLCETTPYGRNISSPVRESLLQNRRQHAKVDGIRKIPAPAGATDNSPALQRWESGIDDPVP